MKERPIIFSTEMVQKILSGTKTQTRRVIKPQPFYSEMRARFNGDSWEFIFNPEFGFSKPFCPFGRVGDRLWVRESWCKNVQPSGYTVSYKARLDYQPSLTEQKWISPLFMPRMYSRITLEITKLCVERLNDISEKDAIAEGCLGLHLQHRDAPQTFLKPQEHFAHVWDEINGKKGFAWAANPFVWVIEFRRVEA